MTAALPPLAAGMELDGFRIEERLHQGGMANLWRVRRIGEATPGEPPLIMKVPRIKGGEDPASIVGFEVEYMLMPSLKGPHVPRYIARGDWTGQAYIVMELIGGDSLRPRLAQSPLPLEQVADIGHRVALALHDLHEQQVVHLDIKPSNIMFRPDGQAVLIDFGLSRHERLPDLLKEELALPMGTGPYMSPEQIHHIRNDPRSDLFALGVMLYHFATGERPFGQPTSLHGLRRRLFVEPVPPRAIDPDIPPWLQEVILHCLEIKPERRYQSAAQLARDLQHPEGVVLTQRSQKMGRSNALRRFKHWFFANTGVGEAPASSQAEPGQAPRSPIIMAAVDIQNATPGLLSQLRETVRRIVQAEPGARLACVSVMRTARIAMDALTDEEGTSVHVKQLIGLRHWARPISRTLKLEDGMEDGRLTFHVLEA
ncbi:MAG: serine/threonine protein kinase, partial [Paucibacter sp.]|nr:serine/threonine protein kinase [Roseateles sp.]